MKIGIIGLGKMGLLHMGILNSIDGVELVSVSEKESLIINYVKNSLPHLNVYSDYNEMIKKETLDVVYVTTPIDSHFPILNSCINNGINFFIEKPLTKNFDESKKLCSRLNNSKIINLVGYNRRFLDTFCKTKMLLDENILGEIKNIKSSIYVSAIVSKSSGWRVKKETGGGALLEFGCHAIDLPIWYFGLINSVKCNLESIYSSQVEDAAHLDVTFNNEISGEIDISWSKKGYRIPEINIEIIGNNGSLRVNQDFIDIKLKEKIDHFEMKETRIYKQELNKGSLIDLGGQDYTSENLHFVDCVKQNHPTRISVFEASKTQSVITSAYSSAEKNKEIGVEYFE